MSQEEIPGIGYWKVKFIFRLVMLAGLIIIWWGIGELIADIIIGIGIEWIRVSSVGSIVIGCGIVVSTAIVDGMVDRLYKLHMNLSKKTVEDV